MLKRFCIYQLPALIFAGLIFFVSSLPAEDVPGPFPHFDKLAHLGEYVIFGYLLSRAFYFHNSVKVKKYYLYLVLAIGILYGLSDEIHQAFTGRSPGVVDFFFDAFGVIFGLVIFNKIKNYERKKISG